MSKEIPKQVIEEVFPIEETVEYADDIDMKEQMWKERVMRAKMICLHQMDLPLTTNPKYMDRKKTLELLRLIEIKILDNDAEILAEFNDLVCEQLLNQESDYSRYPTYNQPSQWKITPVVPPIFSSKKTPLLASEEYCELDCDIEISQLGLNL